MELFPSSSVKGCPPWYIPRRILVRWECIELPPKYTAQVVRRSLLYPLLADQEWHLLLNIVEFGSRLVFLCSSGAELEVRPSSSSQIHNKASGTMVYQRFSSSCLIALHDTESITSKEPMTICAAIPGLSAICIRLQ